MQLKNPKIIFYVYLIVALLELVSEYYNFNIMRFIFKPLLMIVLAFYYYISIKKPVKNIQKIMLAALFFAWGGDVALMFTNQIAIAFLIGLASFLICHILYAIHFSKQITPNAFYKGFVIENKFILVVFIAYAYFLITFVYQGLAEMKIPVFVYCGVIMVMCIIAVNRWGRTNKKSALLILFGALSFMFSDSVIALNKFTILFENQSVFASLIIMTLYILGQFLIVEGSLAHEQTT